MRLTTTRRTILAALAALPVAATRGIAGTPTFTGAAAAPDPQAAAWSSLSLAGEDGSQFRLSEVLKPLAFVNLWANWCPGCLSEMGSMTSMQAAIGAQDIDVMLVSHPTNLAADRDFARSHGLPFKILGFAPGTPDDVVMAAYRSEPGASYSVPQSLVFAGTGHELAWVEEGAHEWDSTASISRLKALLRIGG